MRAKIAIPVGPNDAVAMFHSFDGFPPGEEHFMVAWGPDSQRDGRDEQDAPLVRIHSECITGDLFGSMRCDCGPQLAEAVERLSVEGGYLVYLRQEGRGIGLYAKLDAYALQDQGLDTYEANLHLNYPEDMRAFRPAAEMLRAVGVDRVRLLTNNPQKVEHLRTSGVDVVETVPTGVFVNDVNSRYLLAKVVRANHTLRLWDANHSTPSGRIST